MKINVLDKGYVRLVDQFGTDLTVVNAARVSYDKESKEFSEKDSKLLEFLAREGHFSPFRHAVLTFEVYAPLMVARQWFKYVVASTHIDDQSGWNESSRRYVTENEEFYIPRENEWRSKPENSKQGSGENVEAGYGTHLTLLLEEYVERGKKLYNNFLEKGVAPEQARLFLPAYGMYVRWRWTPSLAALLNFLGQRLENDAQKETQDYARVVKELSERAFPLSIDAWEKTTKTTDTIQGR
jgi:thymidylate synthase (FAD)